MSAKRVAWIGTVIFAGLGGWGSIAAGQDGSGGGEKLWNQFRGPNGSGIAEIRGLPAEFGPDQNLVWRIACPKGYSSPALWRGRIYLTALEGEHLYTIALQSADGAEVWRKEAPRDRREPLDPRNHPASPTPVVDDSGVYVFFPDYGVLAYDLDGNLRWQQPLGPFTNIYGMGASPILIDGKLVLVCDQSLDSYVIALDCGTGKTIWRTARPEATSGHCTPIVRRNEAGRDEILVAGSFFLTAYDVATGEKNWWVGGLCFEMKSTPVIGIDGLVYVNGFGSPQNQIDSEVKVADFADVQKTQDQDGDQLLSPAEMPDETAKSFFPAIDLNTDGKLDRKEWEYYQASMASKNSLMAIRAGGQGDMTSQHVVWKYFRNIPQLPSPLLYRGRLYMVSDQGIVTSLDPQTGKDFKRGRLSGAAGNVYASPVAADEKLYFVTEAGKVVVAEANDDFTVIHVNDLGERCYATPAFDDQRIYIRTVDSLFAFGAN